MDGTSVDTEKYYFLVGKKISDWLMDPTSDPGRPDGRI